MSHWVANCKNGMTLFESEEAPWQWLMDYCREIGTHINCLILFYNGENFHCPHDADGYWQAKSIRSDQSDKVEHFSGVGWVAKDKLHCFWTGSGRSWTELREPTEPQIIWKNGYGTDYSELFKS